MIRNRGLAARRYSGEDEEFYNPMNGVANLADVMLVFACGLMMAIIMFYNVDINSTVKIVDKKELKKTENVTVVDNKGQAVGRYRSKGTVYEDPKTGKMYMVVPNEKTK